MYRILAATLVVGAGCLHAQSNDMRCKGNHQVVSACYVVHGRMQYTNGTPNLRIWVIGTKHYLGVTARSAADDAENPLLPVNVRKKLQGFHTMVYGDFEVCPFTVEKTGAMTMVCVESASHLIAQSLDAQ